MKKVVVGARRTHRVVCEVPQPQSVLKWEFFTTEYDIAYGVHHYNSRTPKDDLVCLLLSGYLELRNSRSMLRGVLIYACK